MDKKLSKEERKHLIKKAEDRMENPEKYGFPFIYVNDDGSARELDDEEKAYLNTEFLPFDGGRPYIKSYYDTKTPDDKLSGYLLREYLPRNIVILQAPKK